MKRKWLWLIIAGFFCITGICLVSNIESTSLQAQGASSNTLAVSNNSQKLTKKSFNASDEEVSVSDTIYSQGLTLTFPDNIKVGDKGSLSLTFSLNGIKLSGKVVVYYDNQALSMDKDGNWEALTNGSTTLLYGYQPSEEMLAQLNSENISPQQSFKQCSFAVAGESKESSFASTGMTLNFPGKITEGETGTLTPNITIGDKEYTSEYVYYYDPQSLTIDAKGNWKALKSGSTQVFYGYQLNETLTNALSQHTDFNASEAALGLQELQITQSSGNTDDSSTDDKDKETEKTEISLGMSLKNFFNESNVGTSGTFKPEVDMNGAVVDGVDYSSVNFDGEFVYYGDSEYISISEDGKWKFLKEGKITVQYGYIPSSQMLADMTAAAKEQGKELNLKAMSLASTEVTVYENHPSNGTINAGMAIKGPSEVKVGDSGTFDISIDPSALNQEGMDFSHIEFDGEYVFYYDESLISIDEKGNWKALKAGDATFGYLWRPSEAMWEEMNKVIEASGKEFILTAIQPIHELTITEESSSRPRIHLGIDIKKPNEVFVGDSGTFEISVSPSALNYNGMDFSHIEFDGELVFDYDESLVSIDEKGNWKALKAGDATFKCDWIPSEAMWKEMEKVIDASGGEFMLTAEAISYPFTIKDRPESSGTSDTSGKEPSGKLPTTGEVQSSLIIAGVILIAGAAIFITKRRKHT